MRRGKSMAVLLTTAILLLGAVFVNSMNGNASEERMGSIQSKMKYGDKATYFAYNDGADGNGLKNVFVWTGQGETAEPNQFFDFRETDKGSGTYVLVSTRDGRVQAVTVTQDQKVVVGQVDETNPNQQWQFVKSKDSDGFYYIKNVAISLYLTTPRSDDSQAMDQQLIVTDKITHTKSQLWKPSIPVTETEDSGDQKPQYEQTHFKSAADDGQYLAVSGGSLAEGAEVMTWTGPEANQIWKLEEEVQDSGEYRLVNVNSHKAITAEDMTEGSKLVQKAIDKNNKRQLWNFVETEPGKYHIRNVSTRLYLTTDVNASGSRILQRYYKDTDMQMWETDADIHAIENPKDHEVKVWIKEGIQVSADTGATVEDGGNVIFSITPREGYQVQNLRLLVNGKEQKLTAKADGSYTCEVIGVTENLTVKAQGDARCQNGYIYIPEDNYRGRNQCLSPRIVEAADGTLYATFENGIPSEVEEGEYSFPIYESEDKGETWIRVGEIVNDDSVHPDEYYKITGCTDIGAPSEAQKVDKNTEGAIRHPWSMQCCPQLYILPEDQGDLKAGTLVCAGVAVPLQEDAVKISDAGFGGLWDSSLDFYYSTDGGRNWQYKSTIATGGENPRNIMGYDPVWEPFFLYHEGNLICYYSDETASQAQKLVYKITTDGGQTWGESVDILSIPGEQYRGCRPGMPVVSQLENGKWILVYETVGMTNPIKSGYKIADDPYDWNAPLVGYNPGENGGLLPDINGVYGGSPYVYTLKDGRVVAGTGSLSEVFVNTKNDTSGEWKAVTTEAPAGYNRCYLQLSTGEFLISGTEGPGFAGQGNKIFVKKVDALSSVIEPQKPDKSKLQEAVDHAVKDSEKEKYTKESWEAYQNALNHAKDVLKDENATEEDITNALTELNKAKDELKEVSTEPGKPGSGDNKPGTGDGNTGNTGNTGNAGSNKPGSTAGKPGTQAGTVKTGDSANWMLWTVLIGVSLAGCTVAVRKRKSNR